MRRKTAHGPFKHWTKGEDRRRSAKPISRSTICCARRLTALAPGAAGCRKRQDDSPARRTRSRWIVDPIDGTRAYLAGRADWSISAALVEDGPPARRRDLCAGERRDVSGGGAARRNAQRRADHGERRRWAARRQARRPQAPPGPACKPRRGHARPAKSPLARAAARARRARGVRCCFRLARQPRLGPCGRRPFGARSRRRADRFRGRAADLQWFAGRARRADRGRPGPPRTLDRTWCATAKAEFA